MFGQENVADIGVKEGGEAAIKDGNDNRGLVATGDQATLIRKGNTRGVLSLEAFTKYFKGSELIRGTNQQKIDNTI